jgi:RNA polymerase sigma factor (sigma-70 family)
MTDGELLAQFQSNRDDDALAALVRRHAPMVWGVCCRLLRNHQDAEDAFQTTFLVLVRKAADVPRQAVANWLYGVARQTAVRLRATAAKRGRRETQVVTMPEPTVAEVRDVDLQSVLDEELGRLPDHYRAVIVLSDLEGMTRKETARQLGIPEGSVASRLARARVLLAKRLTRRGVVFCGASLAAVLSAGSASASAPPGLVASTIEAASRLAMGQAAGISARVAAQTEGVVRAMFLAKLTTVIGVLARTALVVLAGVVCALATDRLPQSSAALAEVSTVKDSPPPRPRAGGKKEPNMLRFVLALDKARYDVGEPIVLTARVTNGRQIPLEIQLTSDVTGQLDGYSFQVRDESGKLVKAPDDRAFRPLSALGSTRSVAPGEASTRELTLNYWVPPLRPGKYSVKGVFQPVGQRDVRAESQAVSFEVADTPPADVRARVSRLTRELREGTNVGRIAPLLGFTGQPEAIGPLTDLLYADADTTAVAAADALLNLDRDRVKNALLEALKVRGPRERLVDLLSHPLKARPEEVTPALVSWLEDKNGDARAAAVEGLRRFNRGKDAGLFPKLVQRLEDALPQVRHRAAAAVGEYQDAAALKALKGVVHDRDPGVAEQAVIAVGWIAAAAKPDSALRTEAADCLRSLLTSEGGRAKQAAYWLGKLGGN